jgi:hypothetical protein
MPIDQERGGKPHRISHDGKWRLWNMLIISSGNGNNDAFSFLFNTNLLYQRNGLFLGFVFFYINTLWSAIVCPVSTILPRSSSSFSFPFTICVASSEEKLAGPFREIHFAAIHRRETPSSMP